MPIRDDFPDEQLLQMNKIIPWFSDIYNYIVASKFPPESSKLYKEKLESDAKYYIWDDLYIPDSEINLVLHFCHSASKGDHYGSTWTARKVLDYGFLLDHHF
ncbi:hypothetical protein CR513_21947, partial [Mucuna pruriens]